MPTPQMLPMLPQSRPVDPEWKCHQSGECCTLPAEVVMTRDERMELIRAQPDIQTRWRDVEGGLVALKAQPCPFFLFNSCTVYAVRPFNCRRFACMRPDPKTEAYEHGGLMGCMNLDIRIRTSRVARRLAVNIQRKAQRWARAHGWSEAM